MNRSKTKPGNTLEYTLVPCASGLAIWDETCIYASLMVVLSFQQNKRGTSSLCLKVFPGQSYSSRFCRISVFQKLDDQFQQTTHPSIWRPLGTTLVLLLIGDSKASAVSLGLQCPGGGHRQVSAGVGLCRAPRRSGVLKGPRFWDISG